MSACKVDDTACPLAEVLDRVGGRWSVHSLVAAVRGPIRLTDLVRRIEGIGRRMLTLTPRNLQSDGPAKRTVHPAAPPEVEYSVTPTAREPATHLPRPMSMGAGVERTESRQPPSWR